MLNKNRIESNGIIANVVLHDLDLYCQGQTVQVAIFTSKGWKMQKNGATQMLHIMTLTNIFKITNLEMLMFRKL